MAVNNRLFYIGLSAFLLQFTLFSLSFAVVILDSVVDVLRLLLFSYLMKSANSCN